jgi:hypothetical protein
MGTVFRRSVISAPYAAGMIKKTPIISASNIVLIESLLSFNLTIKKVVCPLFLA